MRKQILIYVFLQHVCYCYPALLKKRKCPQTSVNKTIPNLMYIRLAVLELLIGGVSHSFLLQTHSQQLASICTQKEKLWGTVAQEAEQACYMI
jgi:hypothetical protein